MVGTKAISAVAMPVLLVVVATVLIVGVYVFSQIRSSINQGGMSADANTTISNVETTTYNAFQLGVIVLIVIAAGAVIGILLKSFRGG